jgi:hypothetical protein
VSDVKNFKGANNTIVVKDAQGKIVTNFSGGTPPPRGVIAPALINKQSAEELTSADRAFFLATAEGVPGEVLALLINAKSVASRILLASAEDTPVAILAVMALDEDEDVRYAAADNWNTPPESLEMLSDDENIGVRVNVANNPNTSTHTLQILEWDEDESVQAGALTELANRGIYSNDHDKALY